MISMDKKYRTCGGRAVRILCVDGPDKRYPVIGWVGDGIQTWTETGEYDYGLESNLDLIEVKPKKASYVNYYSAGQIPIGGHYTSRLDANQGQSPGRTHILIIEQEEGCDPVVRVEKV